MDKKHIQIPWENAEHRALAYHNFPFNDQMTVNAWKTCGYDNIQYTGDLYDMRSKQPVWFDFEYFKKFFEKMGWSDLTWAFYRMNTMNILPEHIDTFTRYKTMYPYHTKYTIMRAVIFLEDWSPGHMLTIEYNQAPQWNAGDVFYWTAGTKHMAANIGLWPRFTLQITGLCK